MLAVLDELWYIGKPFIITDGYRSPQDQIRLWEQGRTTPGRIVTNVKYGKHNMGLAVDCAPYINGAPCWDTDESWWKEYADRAVRRGLKAGFYWKKFKDRPHVEL